MAIKINWQDLQKRIINWQEVQKVMLNWNQIRPSWPTPPTYNYLCLKGVEDGCEWRWVLPYGRWTPWAFFETSTDLVNREDYIMTKWDHYSSPYTWPRITLNKDDVIYIRNKSTSVQSIYGYRFYISGGLLDMIWDVWFLLCKNNTSYIPDNWLKEVFNSCSLLQTAPSLPATTLGRSCYYSMFGGCTSLTTAPQLPVATLADDCYNSMFEGCTSLTAAPQLPTTTLAEGCYVEMFNGCTSLTTAPQLSATTLAAGCYAGMFAGCTSLTTAPSLPATMLAHDCYASMFAGCTSLMTLPSLSVTTLAEDCYYRMFYGCTSIKLSEEQIWEYQTPYRIPTSWTWTLGLDSLRYMFEDTWWTFTGTPLINQTYYTSNQVI